MAAHLPELLLGLNASLAGVGIAALVLAAEVAVRLIEFAFLSRAHPLLSALLAAMEEA